MSDTARRAVVTGGAGFIGSHVAEQLLAAGYRVDVIDSLVSGRRENVPKGATLHAVDIGSADAAQVVRESGAQVLIHLAAQIDVRASVDDPMYDATVNVVGTLNLLEAVRAVPKERRPRVVFASTGGALYGDDVPHPTTESASANPDSAYGVAKLSAELYLAYYARVWGLEHAVLRFSNVYGPRQPGDGEAGVVAMFIERLLHGRPLTIYGDGTQTRDYVYVGDVAAAMLAAATVALPTAGPVESRAFNIGTGAETSVLELVSTLSRVMSAKPTVNHAPARAGELARSSLDASKATRALGWRPKMSLAEGLAKTAEWMRGVRGGA